ncbi:MAG: type II toxin-antitoxin system YafQ family toxin [Lachnospiraceae bacterium]|jgi:mRNA interferase YafQ|nr:type II toxin-antitoxin system YafQ family toxin [Lachnospiraceae bacterium]
MLQVSFVGKFKKDYKTCMKRGYNINLLQSVIDILAHLKPLPPQNKDHSLVGNYTGYRECHILPDWLLIYQQTEKELILYRTGTHSDLFTS